jgi:hypothetical protein
LKQKEKSKIALTIHEALDNLSVISEMDSDGNVPIGIVKNNKFVIGSDDFAYRNVDWVTAENSVEMVNNIKNTYLAIIRYLKEMDQETMTDWDDPNTKKGLQSIMTLVGESAHKLDNYLAGIKGVKKSSEISTCKEYKDLQEFYLINILKKFDGELDVSKEWAREWVENKESINLDLEKSGLKDFETVKRDLEYELFYLCDDDEKPFFNVDLIRNIKLFCDFDESFDPDLIDDPLTNIYSFLDKDLHASADQILNQLKKPMKKFFKEKKNYQGSELASLIYQAFLALMLASNPKNLVENNIGKSSYQYFQDFQLFLRKALECKEYQNMIAYPEKKGEYLPVLINIISQAFFNRLGGIKQEIIGFILRLMRKGEQRSGNVIPKNMPFLSKLVEEDDNLRTLLNLYPNGPLFKDLDILRQEESEMIFDPILQGNIPLTLFDIKCNKSNIKVLHLPCPTKQELISKAKIIPEFKSLLYSYSFEKKENRHIIINLQDRTSWKEYARANSLEKIQSEAEFTKYLSVVSLTKSTHFYYQTELYYDLNNAKEFIDQFYTQLSSPEEYGYFFPKYLQEKDLNKFMKDALEFIHKSFFGSEKKLSRKQRLDFIEIFYLIFTIKLCDILSPLSLSFTCKDAVDKGAAQTAAFYAFTKIISENNLNKTDEEMIIWLLYSPALLIRERAIDIQVLSRMLSCISHVMNEMESNKKQIYKEMKKLFSSNFLDNFTI